MTQARARKCTHPLQYAGSFHCLVEEWKGCEELKPQPKETWTFVDKRREETKHRTEWCAATSRYRCMKCGRGRKYMKMKENAQGRNTWQSIRENGVRGIAGT